MSPLPPPESRSHALPAKKSPPLRKDAQRNRDLLVAAARELFAEQGLNVPLDEIAKRAGVGNATLYRRFPARGDLVEAVFHEDLTAVMAAGERARVAQDAWGALTAYLEGVCALLARDRGVGDLMTTGIEGVPTLDAVHAHNHATLSDLMRRAAADGALRTDVVTEDLLFALSALGTSLPAIESIRPGSWRRPLALLLAGFRATAQHPLPARALTPEETARVHRELGGEVPAG
ncbi:TetR/AcrR family transcriptional regulator [Streptomyces xanthochromogenes]|uniref:TetR family transcriptional regulator n=1 Tax=Streptomyces xanthochromogenes TaxID=67384 RepID=A0ABQ2ZTK2_9ACTN|nr:TetR/AcrR family transcriptional regulator [Streptomyces xanthochromogenes]GGY22375.1 TetR family transcriptional regulator [Streptomyces xanthochromogenes]